MSGEITAIGKSVGELGRLFAILYLKKMEFYLNNVGENTFEAVLGVKMKEIEKKIGDPLCRGGGGEQKWSATFFPETFILTSKIVISRRALHISAPQRRALLKTVAVAPEEAREAFDHQILFPQRPCHAPG